MTPERLAKFKKVVAQRQLNLTVILENVHDIHNIGAVLRTCDSVGVAEIFVLYTEPQLDEERLQLGKRSSSGARKWVDVNYYTDVEACFRHVRKKYKLVLGTHLSKDAKNLYDLDLTQSVALLFGNEHEGISEASLAHSDGNFIIPQMGMVQSLNISVACAVSLYEASRQRKEKGAYDGANPALKIAKNSILEKYIERHNSREDRNSVERLNN